LPALFKAFDLPPPRHGANNGLDYFGFCYALLLIPPIKECWWMIPSGYPMDLFSCLEIEDRAIYFKSVPLLGLDVVFFW